MGRNLGSGQGSIYKRGDKWRGQITINGKRRSYTSEKKKDVINWLAEIRTDSNRGVGIRDESYTVQEWMEIYFEKRVKPRVAENTYYNYKNIIKNHLYPVLGEYDVKDLTTDIIQDAYPKMFDSKKGKKYRNCKYSDGSIKVFVHNFKSGLDYAVEERLIYKNPHNGVSVQKYRNSKIVDAYTAEEQRKIVEHCRNATNIDRVFYLLIATGLRVGECVALTWNDVNLEEGWIEVNKTAVNFRGHMIIKEHPKTEQSCRRIYISQNTIEFLSNLIAHKKDMILPNERGQIYHSSALRSRWMRLCAELNIPYKGLHALRHSWATRAFEGGVEVQTVSKMLGHKSVATTMDIYQSVFSEHKQKAAQIMNAFV